MEFKPRGIPSEPPTQVVEAPVESKPVVEIVEAESGPIITTSNVYKEPLIVSTGSTLLDLAICGGRVYGGGIPGGIIIEIYSEYGLGKTAIASSICGNARKLGGDTQFRDPEGRLDREYAELYGVSLLGTQYKRLQLTNELFDDFIAWDPLHKDRINVYVIDSIAALSTVLEMGEKGDKMGMRKAKEISTGLRKASVIIAEGHKIIVCTNQLREGEAGKFTPGGRGVPYWASVRLEIKPIGRFTKGVVDKSTYIEEKVKIDGKDFERISGINTMVTVVKNSRDEPFRTAPVPIVFNYGVDDIRANLRYLKDMTSNSTFICPDGKSYIALVDAIRYVEDHNLEEELKDQVINLWEKIEAAFKEKYPRKKKK